MYQREREVTDTLVALLITTVRRIGARAERRVTNELINAFKKVTGKENILFSIAEAALGAPDAAVREAVFPCLRILQAALVYVNTLMPQDVLAEDDWTDLLTPEDRRGLTPRFWQHVLPYGEVALDMTTRLRIRTAAPAGGP